MLKEKFEEIYGVTESKIRYFASPGRVNIIGEHIDYNGGLVVPCSLNLGINIAIRKRDDEKISFASTNFEARKQLDYNQIVYDENLDWINYPLGVVYNIITSGHHISGFDVLFDGNIPNGAGLSSSASIEVGMAVALNAIYDLKMDMLEIVKLAQYSENNFNGVNCGIMDQFSVGMGKKNKAILLDCNTLKYSYVPFLLDGYKLLICNTNKRRGLNDSKYNERRSQCEEALKLFNTKLKIENLCQLSVSEFENNKNLLTDQVIMKRAKHVVYENERVKCAIVALKENNLVLLGKLLNESHESLKNDYEVTGIELDTIVEEAIKLPYVLGARMTGAGFGGCAISLVKDNKVEQFINEVTSKYEEKIGYKPSIYVGETGDGALEIHNNAN